MKEEARGADRTTNATALADVEKYFEQRRGVGLVLPRGWYGRPHDNWFTLTGGEASIRSLRLELNGEVQLRFEGTPRVATTDDGLQIGGFDELALAWGTPAAEPSEVFRSGAVLLVPSQWRQ